MPCPFIRKLISKRNRRIKESYLYRTEEEHVNSHWYCSYPIELYLSIARSLSHQSMREKIDCYSIRDIVVVFLEEKKRAREKRASYTVYILERGIGKRITWSLLFATVLNREHSVVSLTYVIHIWFCFSMTQAIDTFCRLL